MSGFFVVSLFEQIEAVIIHVNSWTKPQFLDWLTQFGTVEKVDAQLVQPNTYWFQSNCGLGTGFILTDDCKIKFLDQNKTWQF